MPFLLLWVLGLLGLVAGCTGSGAVNPLTPQRSTVSDSTAASSSSVIYWTSFPVTFSSSDSLNGVDMISPKSGWACGNNGTLLRYDGETWSKVSMGLAQTENFMALAFSDDNNGWMVGTHGVILSYKGGQWSLFPSPTQQNLYAITVLPNRTAWAVGANGTLINFNGVSWSSIDLSKLTPPVTGDLNSISLSDQNNGWAVGDNGVILRYDGQSWKTFAASPSTEKLNSVSAVDNVQAWIVGAYGTILRFNGTTWTSAGSSFSGFDLYRVLMRGESDGWAMGQDGNILYYDGSRWIPHPKPDSKPSLNDLSFAGDTGFAVGQAGVIFKFESKGESPQFSFLFKGKVEPAKTEPKLWTLTYTLLNEALATSPAVSFELKLPKDFKPYVEKATPTPTPLADLRSTLSPIPTPTPEIVHPGAVTGTGKVLAQTQPQAMTVGWKLDGDEVRWDLGAVASSEIKTFSLRFEVPKNWDPRKNAIFKASLKSQDQDVADAAPVTLQLTPSASPSPTPATPTATSTPGTQP